MLTRLRNGSWIYLGDISRIEVGECNVWVHLQARPATECVVFETREDAQAYAAELATRCNAIRDELRQVLDRIRDIPAPKPPETSWRDNPQL